jgi:hypothetical protein
LTDSIAACLKDESGDACVPIEDLATKELGTNASDVYELLCSRGSADGCYMQFKVKQTPELMAQLKKHCAGGKSPMLACDPLTITLWKQYNVTKANTDLLELYEAAEMGCKSHAPNSCFIYAAKLAVHDAKAALSAYEDACQSGLKEACSSRDQLQAKRVPAGQQAGAM